MVIIKKVCILWKQLLICKEKKPNYHQEMFNKSTYHLQKGC